jgi:hypothetical protein
MNINDKSDFGYTFSVDLHIREKLHDHMNNYPLCAENISMKEKYFEKLFLTFLIKKNIK